MVLHTGLKQYECGVCGESFAYANNLKQHSTTHTKEMKHACSFCGQSFAYKATLKIHIAIHSE